MSIQTLIQAYPIPSILIFSLLATCFVTLISYFLTDRKLMKEIKEKQKRVREEMKLHKGDQQKMMELNKQLMEDFPHQIKQSMKISVVTLVPMLALFTWLRKIYVGTTIANLGWFHWPIWIWWYVGSSLVFSIALRKIFKLD